MPALRTIAFSQLDESTLLLVHGRAAPSADDWEQWVATIWRLREERPNMGALIVTPHGAGPNAAQRKAVNDALQGHTHAVAVMSDHRATRAIITAFSWFNSGLKSFRITDFEGAARHLGMRNEGAARLPSEVAAFAEGLALGRTSAVG